MKLSELKLKDAYLIELEPIEDERGSFVRQFCKNEFRNHSIDVDICQCNISTNNKKGTLRGLHYQKDSFSEPKLVSCTKGAIFDVVVDLRKDSMTYLQWQGFELSESNNKMLYVPQGFAHGFQTLVDDTVVYYQMGNYYAPEQACGLRWNDPKLAIKWPECEGRIINERDNSYELL